MCLNHSKPISLKRKRSGYGYKIFSLYSNRIEFEWGFLGGRRECPAGEWLVAEMTGPRYVVRGMYRTGFHIFKSRKAALISGAGHAYFDSCVIRVRYSDAFSEGMQNNYPALVAGRLYVPKSELRRTKKILDLRTEP